MKTNKTFLVKLWLNAENFFPGETKKSSQDNLSEVRSSRDVQKEAQKSKVKQ